MKPVVLITGVTGNLGRILLPKLLGKYQVVGCAREESKIGLEYVNFSFETIDLTSKEKVFQLFVKYNFNVIVHLAAILRPDKDKSIDLYNNNVLSTFNILSCLKKRCKLIFASSMTVYGLPKKLPVTETSDLNPQDAYAKSKVACEELIKKFSETKHFQYLILRLPGIFYKERRNGALYNFVKNAIEGKEISITINQPITWDFLYAEDAVDSIIAGLSKNDLDNRIINVGYGEKIEIEELAKRIKQILGSKSKIVKNYSFKNPAFYYDTSNFKSYFGIKLPSLGNRLREYISYMKGQ